MQKPSEPAFLLRVEARLPVEMRLTIREFWENWNFVLASDSRRLRTRVKKCGWQVVVDTNRLLTSGIGKTPQEARAAALKLALVRVGAAFNAARVEYFTAMQYPWFFLAKVAVYPHSIQQSVVPLLAGGPVPARLHHSNAHVTSGRGWLFPLSRTPALLIADKRPLPLSDIPRRAANADSVNERIFPFART